jgi:outer membrane protein assembly factor BamD
MFLILKSSYLLADGSVPSKQLERYQTTVDEYYSYIDEFPDNKNSKEAKRMYETSNKFLENHSKKS